MNLPPANQPVGFRLLGSPPRHLVHPSRPVGLRIFRRRFPCNRIWSRLQYGARLLNSLLPRSPSTWWISSRTPSRPQSRAGVVVMIQRCGAVRSAPTLAAHPPLALALRHYQPLAARSRCNSVALDSTGIGAPEPSIIGVNRFDSRIFQSGHRPWCCPRFRVMTALASSLIPFPFEPLAVPGHLICRVPALGVALPQCARNSTS